MLIQAKDVMALLQEAILARDAANLKLMGAEESEWRAAKAEYRRAYDRVIHLARALGEAAVAEPPWADCPPDRFVFVEDDPC